MTTTIARLRGLRSLLQDIVVEGSKAIERVQHATAARPFYILERIEPLAGPAQKVHALHDLAVSGTHGMVRLWTRAVGATIEVILDIAEPPP